MLSDFGVFEDFHCLRCGQAQQFHNIFPLVGTGQRLLVIPQSPAGLTFRYNRIHESEFGHKDAFPFAHRTCPGGVEAEQAVRPAAFPCQQLSYFIEKAEIGGGC